MTRLERRRQRFKERYHSDPEFREAAKADSRARRRILYRTNPDYCRKVKEKSALYYETNVGDPDFQRKRMEYQRRPDVQARRAGAVKRLLHTARWNARLRGRPFSISAADVEAAWPDDNMCPILKVELQPERPRDDAKPSLDCIIPALGYVPGNVAVISWRANRIKGSGSLEEHERIVVWMRSATQIGAIT